MCHGVQPKIKNNNNKNIDHLKDLLRRIQRLPLNAVEYDELELYAEACKHEASACMPVSFLSYYSMWYERNETVSHSVMSNSLWPHGCSLPGSSIHGISQARILDWVTISSSTGSSRLRNRTQVSCIAGRFFTGWATREAHVIWEGKLSGRITFLTLSLQGLWKD